jgi:hypothetical protein
MKIIRIFLVSLALTGCATNFSRVPFKYTNLAHMNYRDAMISVSRMPEELVFDLSEAFRHNGANVLERTKLKFIISENSDAQKCWEATYEIFQQEFAAYRANNFPMFNSIDREKPFTSRQIKNNCTYFSNINVLETESWFLLVELPPRTSQTTVYQPTMDNFFLFGQNKTVQGFSTSYIPEQVAISISTKIYIWAWRPAGEQKTRVYLHAIPVSGQIEAKVGNSIGYSWWQIANGYSEQQTVRNYISLIQEYDRKKKLE